MQIIQQNRRDFLASASWPSAAGVLGARGSLADEGPPETTTIRLAKYPNICLAPQYVAEELLRAEGFTDIRYVPDSRARTQMVARGEIDFDLETRGMARPSSSMPASRSRRWRACIPAATSCSRTSPSEPSAT